jgi:hypothetical protein
VVKEQIVDSNDLQRIAELADKGSVPTVPRAIVQLHQPERKQYSPFVWGLGLGLGIFAAFVIICIAVTIFVLSARQTVISRPPLQIQPGSAATPSASSTATPRVQSTELCAAYQYNEFSAASTYGQKRIEVWGHVTQVSKDELRRPFVSLDGREGGAVVCRFPRDIARLISQVHVGDSMLIEGRCTGMAVGNVQVEDSVVISHGP